jgi:transposase InsO family protein
MHETRVTLEKLCALGHWTPAYVRVRARTEGWETRDSESRGRNGKKQHEYLESSLPADLQAKLAAERKTCFAITPPVGQTLPLFAAAPEVPEPVRLQLDEKEREEADKWLDAITQLNDLKERAKSGKPLHLPDGKALRLVDDIADFVGKQMSPPKSGRTVLRKLEHFTGGKKREKAGGYPGLARKIRCDEGKSRYYEANPDMAFLAQQKFLNEALSMQLAHEAVCRECRNRSKEPPKSYTVTWRFLSNIAEAPKTLAREGAEKYMRHAPFILRKAPPAGAWGVSDHRQFDVFCRNRLFNHLNENQMYRPWLTALYDWGSRKITGFCLAPSPNAATIGSSIRMAARQFGFPMNLYWDQGKDYRKMRRELARIELVPEIRGLLSANGVQVTSALPYHPRSKPIESWFARWSKRFDPTWGAAYAGNKPENCRPQCREAQREHAKYLAGKRSSSPLPTDTEFFIAAVEYIEEYNTTAHLDCLDGRTPDEVFDEQYPPESRRKVDELSLNILLSQKCERTVLAGGCVEIDKLRYEPDEQSLGALDLLNGQRAKILRDPYDLGEAVALDERGRFVGTLHIQPFVEQSPGGRLTQDAIKAGMKRQRTLKRNYVEGLAAIAAFGAGQGWRTESEGLVDRTLARTGTDGRLLSAAAPGARGEAAPARAKRAAQPAFVSDAVAEEPDFMSGVKLED